MPDITTMQRGRFRYRVNGSDLRSVDGNLSGREIRSAAGYDPASEHVLIRVGERGTTSVGLDERVVLVEGELPVFRAFVGDRVWSFTLDERGYEWGAESIDETELRAIARIGDDLEIVLDGDRDEVVAHGSSIPFNAPGAERLRTRPAREVSIVVNGRPRTVPAGKITYEALMTLALGAAPGPNASVTVIYRDGPRERPEGSLVQGQSVHVRTGMIFNVTTTDKS